MPCGSQLWAQSLSMNGRSIFDYLKILLIIPASFHAFFSFSFGIREIIPIPPMYHTLNVPCHKYTITLGDSRTEQKLHELVLINVITLCCQQLGSIWRGQRTLQRLVFVNQNDLRKVFCQRTRACNLVIIVDKSVPIDASSLESEGRLSGRLRISLGTGIEKIRRNTYQTEALAAIRKRPRNYAHLLIYICSVTKLLFGFQIGMYALSR